MPSPDLSVRPESRDRPDASLPPPAQRRLSTGIGLALVAAGWGLFRCPALNTLLFHAVNELGPAAPTLWSCLSVAGLGLSAFIYLSAFAQARPERVARLLWILVVGGIVIHFIKHGCAAPRPLLALGAAGANVIGEPLRTQSMPSGHSAMAFAMIGLLLAEGGAGRRLVRLMPWFALALGIALSRLAVGAHWPADALVGAGLGLVFAGIAPQAWPVAATTRLLARPLGGRLMAAGLTACALSIAATPAILAALGRAGARLERQLATGYPLAEPLQWVLAIVALAGALRWWRAAAATKAA